MKLKIFIGPWYETQDAFNQWAKGKALTKEVLIHTHIFNNTAISNNMWAAIVVIHPEDPQWDRTETPQKTPIIDVPIPQTKIEEIKVTQ